MYLITLKENNEILNWDTEMDTLPNGYPRLVNKNAAFVPDIINIDEVDKIPDYVISSKYCFTKSAGFYLNPNWVEPPIPTEQLLSDIEDALVELAGLIG